MEAVAGTATVTAVFWALSTTLPRRTVYAAAGLLALSPFHIWYSQEIRGYAFLMLFVVLSLGAFTRIARWTSEQGDAMPSRAGARTWALYTAANLLAILSSLAGAFLLIGQALVLLAGAARRRVLWRRFVLSWMATFLMITPWIYQFWERRLQPSGALSLEAIPASERIRGGTTAPAAGIPYTYYTFAVGFSYGPSLRELHQMDKTGLTPLLRPHLPAIAWAFAAFGAAAALGAMRLYRAGWAGRTWLVLAIVPLLLTWAVSLRNVKVFNPRYAAAAFPPFITVVAAGVASPRSRWASGLLFLALAAPAAASTWQLRTEPRYWKEDAAGVAAFLRENVGPEDAMLMVGTDVPFREYYWRFAGTQPEGLWQDVWNWNHLPWEEKAEQLDELRGAHRKLFVILLRPKDPDPQGAWEAYLRREHGEARVQRFAGASVWVLEGTAG